MPFMTYRHTNRCWAISCVLMGFLMLDVYEDPEYFYDIEFMLINFFIAFVWGNWLIDYLAAPPDGDQEAHSE